MYILCSIKIWQDFSIIYVHLTKLYNKNEKGCYIFFSKKIQKGLSEHRDINNMSLMKDKDQRIRIPQKYFKINKDFYGTWSGINIEKKIGYKKHTPMEIAPLNKETEGNKTPIKQRNIDHETP